MWSPRKALFFIILSAALAKLGLRLESIDLAQVELQGMNFQYVDFQPYFRGPELSLEDLYADVNQGVGIRGGAPVPAPAL